MQQVIQAEIGKIRESPYQGRLIEIGIKGGESEQTSLNRLAENIRQNGLLTPVILRQAAEGYELIDGHRRLEACRMLGYTTIDAIVKEMDDRGAQVMSIVGNLQREELSAIERALAFRKVLEAGLFKDKKELSQAIGKDQTYVGDLLNTLNMDKRIIDDLLQNKTTNDVRLLRAIRRAGNTNEEGYSEMQWALYRRFVDEGLSRKEVLTLSSRENISGREGISVDFKPRRIEISLPKKYTLKQRKLLESEIRKKIEELLNMRSA